jgi:hypothetical protein
MFLGIHTVDLPEGYGYDRRPADSHGEEYFGRREEHFGWRGARALAGPGEAAR